MLNVAIIYERGEFVEKNYEESLKYYNKLAEINDVKALSSKKKKKIKKMKKNYFYF